MVVDVGSGERRPRQEEAPTMVSAPDRATFAESLPFPPTPSGSTAGRTVAESVYNPLPKERHLPDDAPNILIVCRRP